MALTPEYFLKAPLALPQDVTNTGIPAEISSANGQRLQDSIDTYEPMFLDLLLGKTLSKKYQEDESEIYAGLTELLYDDTKKTSVIAKFVYFWHLSDYSAHYTGEAFSKGKSDNSTTISVVQKQVFVWKLMKDELKSIFEYLLNVTDAAYSDLDMSGWVNLRVNYNSFGI